MGNAPDMADYSEPDTMDFVTADKRLYKEIVKLALIRNNPYFLNSIPRPDDENLPVRVTDVRFREGQLDVYFVQHNPSTLSLRIS